MKWTASVTATCILLLASIVYRAEIPTDKVVRVGTGKQLFIDNSLISHSEDVTLTMNPPCKTEGHCIVSDKPWENFYAGGYNTVMEDQGTYKMWYESGAYVGTRYTRDLCYATSSDGIHWIKPNLGVVDYEGSKENNIVLAVKGAPGQVFIDPNDAHDRFKFVEREESGQYSTLVLYTSSDGIHWRPFLDRPILAAMGGQFDTQNQIFWDDQLDKFVGYFRTNVPNPNSKHRRFKIYPERRVSRSETNDLAHWPSPVIVFSADGLDPPESDHYTSCVNEYPYAPNVYLMFPNAFFHFLDAKNDDGALDIQLATSRDGIHWNRLDRRPCVRRGLTGSEDGGSLYMNVGMLRKGDEIWMYYTGYDFTHGGYDKSTRKKGVVKRVVQRLDGFISADAAYSGGELTTLPIVFEGKKLVLNVDTGALGTTRVELSDEKGNAIPGFGADDCDRINGNFISRGVAWKGNSDVGALAGKVIRLRFVMRSTKLYAFQFQR